MTRVVSNMEWWLHAGWQCVALIVGMYTGYIGLKLSKEYSFGKKLPGKSNRALHVRTGPLFIVLLFIGIITGIFYVESPNQAPFPTIHFYLAAITLSIYSLGAIVGLQLKRGHEKFRKSHRLIMLSGCTFLGITMLCGMWYANLI